MRSDRVTRVTLRQFYAYRPRTLDWSFFESLKVERTYRLRYISRDQARLDIVNWSEGFYNEKRLHSAIDYRSPADFERSLKAA